MNETFSGERSLARPGRSCSASIEMIVLVVVLLAALAASLIYQGTNAAIYHMIVFIVYFWAYREGEVCTFN